MNISEAQLATNFAHFGVSNNLDRFVDLLQSFDVTMLRSCPADHDGSKLVRGYIFGSQRSNCLICELRINQNCSLISLKSQSAALNALYLELWSSMLWYLGPHTSELVIQIVVYYNK